MLKANNMILFAFYPMNDYNLKIIKISLFFISFDIFFFFNFIFFDNLAIHKIYIDKGVYNFSYFISKIIYSFIISYCAISLIKYFSLSQRNLLVLREEEDLKIFDSKVVKIKKCLYIKYILFYTICFIFLIFFWYYLSMFCAVYKNTQFYIIKNTFISYRIYLLYSFFFNIITCTIRLFSLKESNQRNEFIYKISKIIQLL